jgi:hypothetical protein
MSALEPFDFKEGREFKQWAFFFLRKFQSWGLIQRSLKRYEEVADQNLLGLEWWW